MGGRGGATLREAAATAVKNPAPRACALHAPSAPLGSRHPGAVGGDREEGARACAGVGLAHAHGGSGGSCLGLRAAGNSEGERRR